MGGKASKDQSHNKKKEAPNITDHDRAVLMLKVVRDSMSKHRKKLDDEVIKLTKSALELSRNNKRDRAKMLLKLKNVKLTAAKQLEDKLFNVKVMIDKLDEAASMKNMFEALEEGKKQLELLNNEITAEDMSILMEETEEAIQMQNDIQNALAGPLTNSINDTNGKNTYSDDEIERQLALLDTDDVNHYENQNINTPKEPVFPSVPTSTIGSVNNSNTSKTFPSVPTNSIDMNQNSKKSSKERQAVTS